MSETSNLVSIIKYCKGVSENSMLSMCIPSKEHIKDIISELKSRYNMSCSELITTKSLSLDDDDSDKVDCEYKVKVYHEASQFLKGLVFQEEDEKCMGLIFYYGYIDDGGSSTKSKKIFHTFPAPKKFSIDYIIKIGNRFDIGMLNLNKWYTEEFGIIK